ncbi:polysaccharide deacetylase family protein [Nocardioides sp.]|uniref:polysaccharide deacetylase family protein n=1 Tax=Nocardioides sp. TaxID=35761 RepID=UPI003D0C8863
MTEQTNHWPDDTRMVLTLSLMFEAGAQVWPDSVYLGPLGPIEPGYRDIPGETFFEYGWVEAIPRLLDLFDRHDVKMTCFPVARAAQRNPHLIKDMVARGHEVAAHGLTWVPQCYMEEAEEREFIRQSVEIMTEISGSQPLGWNCWGLRGTERTLDLLQEHGLKYHIDEVNRDEPFVRVLSNGEPFAVVPYTLHNNDLLCFEALSYTPQMYLQQLKDEFDWLYQESATRRRMMPLACHDRTLGRPGRVKVMNEFFEYVLSHPGVKFMRRDAIADVVLDEWRADSTR